MAMFASKHIYKQRMDICKACPEYMQRIYTCRECGCFMPAKSKIANIRCPKDKWTEVYGTEDVAPADDVPDDKEELLKLADALEREARNIRESLK
ncbi:hypothetical protein EB151_00135 [archaeon]|nr:hypothetical protein [archaeon]